MDFRRARAADAPEPGQTKKPPRRRLFQAPGGGLSYEKAKRTPHSIIDISEDPKAARDAPITIDPVSTKPLVASAGCRSPFPSIRGGHMTPIVKRPIPTGSE